MGNREHWYMYTLAICQIMNMEVMTPIISMNSIIDEPNEA